ncbi:MAG: amidophosphoribosyltransferase [Endomicrobia bacterium]|jgi:amidophosphoribosyltransferase|nr:amidophosphoribosyltransferase [Bacillota bacterium]MCL1972272.1 amidophosphoribosyltransferase [Endomicrobiia bacterium]
MSGIFGVVSATNCAEDLVYGTDYHTHMGTEYGGIAVFGKEFKRYIHKMSSANFKTRFFENIKDINGQQGIGVVSDFDEQPIYLKSKLGEFCIVSTGKVDNINALTREMLEEGISFSEMSKKSVNATELLARIIATGKDIKEGIEKVYKRIIGSASILVLTKDGIYGARDSFGRSALILGRKEGSWAICSETTSFSNLDFEPIRDLNPGEIVFIDAANLECKVIRPGNGKKQVCAFLWMYTGFPASNYEGINSEVVREESGKLLAKRDKDLKADMVVGIPDSGIAHAVGYAIESKIPLRRPLVKYTPTYGRSYTPPSQGTRDIIARMKLIAIKEIIQNNVIILLEDSIVRGTQLKNVTVDKFWKAGAKELHVRPASPPLLFPCLFSASTRTNSELVTRRAISAIEGKDIEDVSEYTNPKTEKYAKMIEWIRKDLNVTSLKFQTVEDMVTAIGLPREQLCLHCWLGCTGCK